MHPDAEAYSRQLVTAHEGFPSRGRFKSFPTMNRLTATLSILLFAVINEALAQVPATPPPRLVSTTNLPYATPSNPRQMVDIYAPEGAKNLPVIFWIHGGGWESGDRTAIQLKPQAFVDKGFVFVSTGYLLNLEVE
jgi:arylformamidase